MSFVPVPGDIATVTESVDGLAVSIPAKRNLFVLVFLTFWLIGWAFGEVTVPLQLLNPQEPNVPTTFLLAWLGMWTIGGGAAISIWAWMQFGQERVVLGSTALVIGRRVSGMTRSKEYDLSAATNLQLSSIGPTHSGAGSKNLFSGIAGGALQFDYRSKTIRFGAGLEEAEAKRICAQLIKRRPSLGGGRAA